MSVLLSKILSSLIHPLNLAIYGWLMAGVLRLIGWRTLATVGAVLSTLWLMFWSIPFTAEPILGAWEQKQAPTLAELATPADVIVVLGGGVKGAAPPVRPRPDLGDASDRVWAGARLWHAGKAPLILVSGGKLPWNGQTHSEADGMLALLLDLGVPRDAIRLESGSQTTFENAQRTQPILAELETQSALLVTSAFHMQRSLATYQKQMPEIDWAPFATDIQIVPRQPSLLQYLPSVATLISSQQYLRERVGIWVYQCQERL